MTDTLVSETTTAAVRGFIGKPRTRRVECAWPGLEPQDGAEPLWAVIRSDIPFGDLDDIPLGGDASYTDLWESIAEYIIEWNVLGFHKESGEYRVVPPPAEIGIVAFRKVDTQIGLWLGVMLKQTYKSVTSDPKASTGSNASDGTPNKASEPASGSSSPAKASRPSRKG